MVGPTFGSAKLGPRSQQGANKHSGAPESGGGETARRGFWAGCRDRGRAEPVGGRGACPGREGACPGAGTAICGGGTKRPELDPRGHSCEYRILAGVGVAAQAGRRWDAAGPGVRRRGLSLSAVGVAPGGVPCVSGLQGAGHFGPREGGWQPACEPQPQARSGARAEEPGRSPPGGNAPLRRS